MELFTHNDYQDRQIHSTVALTPPSRRAVVVPTTAATAEQELVLGIRNNGDG